MAQGWYQQDLQLGRSIRRSGSCQLLQLPQCFNAPTSPLSQQPNSFDASLFWKEELRMDGWMFVSSQSRDRGAVSRRHLANSKAPPVPSSPMQWDPSAVQTEEHCSKGQPEECSKKSRGCSNTTALFYSNCVRPEAALYKIIKAFCRSTKQKLPREMSQNL